MNALSLPNSNVGVVAAAKASSLATTQRLASSGSVFAVAAAPGMAPAGAPTQQIIPGSGNDPVVAALAAQAQDACYVKKDAASCMSYSYALASMQAAASCPNGAVTRYITQQKMRGSIDEWLQPPVPYATVRAATSDVASVAVATGTLSPLAQ